MFATPRMPDHIMQLLCAVQSRRQQRAAVRELDAAVECAFGRFALRHAALANSLFDRHFLRCHAAPTLAAFVAGELNRQQAAEQLVMAWDLQFGGAETEKRRRSRDALTPVAHRFLSWLAAEL